LGGGIPKCLVEIEGVPLLFITAAPFEAAPEITEIVLVVPARFKALISGRTQTATFHKTVKVVAGGRHRSDSVRNGLAALLSDVRRVLIHDGARPFVSHALIKRVVDGLGDHKAVCPAIPVSDTLHRDDNGMAVTAVSREGLVAAQTPQGFDRRELEEAFKLSAESSQRWTDEIVLVREICGVEALIVPGESTNIKLTYPEDFEFHREKLRWLAKNLLRRCQTGRLKAHPHPVKMKRKQR
jgi:2-C-methyl-D-erythritol 4-phosphate cytidylyltransferase